MKLNRSVEGWKKMSPEAVSRGSIAQMFYCISDAREDILAMQAEIDRMTIEFEAALENVTNGQ